MSKASGSPPPPLPEISERLSVRTIFAGAVLHRAHRHDLAPIWFGPGARNPPKYRFDAPDGSFQVCYLGLSERAAFVEGVLHKAIPRRIISGRMLAERAISEVKVINKLQVARVYGKYLIPTGASTTVTHGEPYEIMSQPWAKAIHDHKDGVDGIMYTARHDESQYALALFDRAASKIQQGFMHRLSRTDLRTLRLVDHYKLAVER
jgi:hypothetical protein